MPDRRGSLREPNAGNGALHASAFSELIANTPRSCFPVLPTAFLANRILPGVLQRWRQSRWFRAFFRRWCQTLRSRSDQRLSPHHERSHRPQIKVRQSTRRFRCDDVAKTSSMTLEDFTGGPEWLAAKAVYDAAVDVAQAPVDAQKRCKPFWTPGGHALSTPPNLRCRSTHCEFSSNQHGTPPRPLSRIWTQSLCPKGRREWKL